MKDAFNNIDELILTKSYSDLSKEELIAVSELASNESDFNQLKATMLAIQQQMANEEPIVAKPETKAALLKEFKSVRPAAIPNSSRMGLGFFFPKGKPLASMPGLQILTAAACLLMIITVFRNIDLKGTDKKVAYQETIEETNKGKDKAITEKEIINKELTAEGKDIAVTDEVQKPVVVNSENESSAEDINTKTEITSLKKDDLDTRFDAEETVTTGGSSGKFKVSAEVDATDIVNASPTPGDLNISNDFELAEAEEEVSEVEEEIAATESDELMDDAVSIERSSSAGLTQPEMAVASASKFSKDAKKMDNQPAITLSRTLEEDSELIDLFYTAM